MDINEQIKVMQHYFAVFICGQLLGCYYYWVEHGELHHGPDMWGMLAFFGFCSTVLNGILHGVRSFSD